MIFFVKSYCLCLISFTALCKVFSILAFSFIWNLLLHCYIFVCCSGWFTYDSLWQHRTCWFFLDFCINTCVQENIIDAFQAKKIILILWKRLIYSHNKRTLCVSVCMCRSSIHNFEPISLILGMDTPWNPGSDVG